MGCFISHLDVFCVETLLDDTALSHGKIENLSESGSVLSVSEKAHCVETAKTVKASEVETGSDFTANRNQQVKALCVETDFTEKDSAVETFVDSRFTSFGSEKAHCVETTNVVKANTVETG